MEAARSVTGHPPGIRSEGKGWYLACCSKRAHEVRGPCGATHGGGRGIRTPGRREPPAVFKTAAISRSAIPPFWWSQRDLNPPHRRARTELSLLSYGPRSRRSGLMTAWDATGESTE